MLEPRYDLQILRPGDNNIQIHQKVCCFVLVLKMKLKKNGMKKKSLYFQTLCKQTAGNKNLPDPMELDALLDS